MKDLLEPQSNKDLYKRYKPSLKPIFHVHVNTIKEKLRHDSSVDAFDEELIKVQVSNRIMTKPPGTTESDKAVKTAILSYNNNVLLSRSKRNN